MKLISLRMKKNNEQALSFRFSAEDNGVKQLLANLINICVEYIDKDTATFSITSVITDVKEEQNKEEQNDE